MLAKGDAIAEGGPATSCVVSTTERPSPQPVYNLIIRDDHTYFVWDGNSSLWVHNGCGPRRGAFNDVMEDSGYLSTHGGLSCSKIESYAEAMSNGSWDWEAMDQPMEIGPSNEILGGRHRMVAAHMAGVEVPAEAITRVGPGYGRIYHWSEVFGLK